MRVDTSLRPERRWFLEWVPTVRAKLVLYEKVFEALYLRPAEIQRVVDAAVRADILRDALRNHPAEWQDGPEALGRGEPLPSIIAGLFGEEVPTSVALVALESLVREADESDSLDVAVGRAVLARETERSAVGEPTYIWLIEVGQQGRMTVSVRRRSEVAGAPAGLVKVTDAR